MKKIHNSRSLTASVRLLLVMFLFFPQINEIRFLRGFAILATGDHTGSHPTVIHVENAVGEDSISSRSNDCHHTTGRIWNPPLPSSQLAKVLDLPKTQIIALFGGRSSFPKSKGRFSGTLSARCAVCDIRLRCR